MSAHAQNVAITEGYGRGALRGVLRNAHWFVTLGLLLVLGPLAARAGIPLRYPWQLIFVWARSVVIYGVLLAAVLYVMSSPREAWRRLSKSGPSIPFPNETLAGIAVSMLYFLVVFLLVLTYNDIIAAFRFDGSADVALSRADSWLLGGHSVIGWAHWTLNRHPDWFRTIEYVYLLCFCLMAACIVTVGISDGPRRLFQLMGAFVTAYYVALLLFVLFPASGPYLFDHSSVWPKDSLVYGLEMSNGVNLPQFHNGYRPQWIGSDYFIALPCMHIVQPLVMIWFLRKNRTLAWIFAIYTIVLIPCIFLLEEHYVVDVLAAIPVAAFAIFMIDGLEPRYGTP